MVQSQSMKVLLRRSIFVLILAALSPAPVVAEGSSDYPYQPVPFNEVQLNDAFWAPRIRLNASLTIPYAFDQSEQTGRIKNFEIAAGREEGEFCSIYPFDDSDVFKIIEGASYSLHTVPDPKLDAYLDVLIEKIGAAQESDGYLYTNRTIMKDKPHEWAGTRRWELVHKLSHELYNLGHLYEAAVAHYQATGKRSLLDIAIKSADLLVKDFGWGKVENYPGHQEIEIGLAKLYRVTGKKEYLDLAKFFLDIRGPGGDPYNQAHEKVVDQSEAVGHAVRANYMYSGMADVAALTGDQRYVEAIDRIWNDVVSRKLYITGGVGATSSGEAYGQAYELPNMSAYSETCASIANVLWNQRMFLLHGESRFIDVLERTLYNGVLAGLGLSGDHFFYPNPLQSKGQHTRSAWFGCACCPSNLTRFLASIPGYVYAHRGDSLYVNLFVESSAKLDLGEGRTVSISQRTGYPWQGQVTLTLDPAEVGTFDVLVRIPGWLGDQAVPSALYQFADTSAAAIHFKVNGSDVTYEVRDGYAVLTREWKKGDEISFEIPLEIRQVVANPQVEADRGRIALQRGPLVYCLEWPDQPDGQVLNLMLSEDRTYAYAFAPDLLNGVGTIKGRALSISRTPSGGTAKSPVAFQAIPYYAWANRGAGEMTVWIPVDEAHAEPLPLPTIASESTVTASDPKGPLSSVNDQLVPPKSSSHEFGYIHWWPKQGSTEWVEYSFKAPATVDAVAVMWFDDEDIGGGCRVPQAWKVLVRKEGTWKPVATKHAYGMARDSFNRVEFDPVETDALRLEIVLPSNFSSGIQEWEVE